MFEQLYRHFRHCCPAQVIAYSLFFPAGVPETQVGVSEIGDPNSTLNNRIPIIRTPRSGTPTFRKLTGGTLEARSSVLDAAKGLVERGCFLMLTNDHHYQLVTIAPLKNSSPQSTHSSETSEHLVFSAPVGTSSGARLRCRKPRESSCGVV